MLHSNEGRSGTPASESFIFQRQQRKESTERIQGESEEWNCAEFSEVLWFVFGLCERENGFVCFMQTFHLPRSPSSF